MCKALTEKAQKWNGALVEWNLFHFSKCIGSKELQRMAISGITPIYKERALSAFADATRFISGGFGLAVGARGRGCASQNQCAHRPSAEVSRTNSRVSQTISGANC